MIYYYDDEVEPDLRMNGSQILNGLKDLLLNQFRNSHKLRDIKFKCVSNIGLLNIKNMTQRLNLLYLMLIYVLKQDNIKYRKELNMEFTIVYKADDKMRRYDNYYKYISPNCNVINKLLDILNVSVECFTFKIIFKQYRPKTNHWINHI